MSAARTPMAGDVRFEVSYCPTAHAEKIRSEDETAWPGDYCLHATFSDFRAAAAFAAIKSKDDWFGMTQVRRFVCKNPKYDWWEETGVWEIEPDHQPGDIDPAA